MFKISFLSLILFSTVWSFNHPEIKWKTVNTNNFIINYYDATEPALYATWKIAEETYKALSDLYNYKHRNKITISIADYDDYSNGFAEWTASNVMIWVPYGRFDLRSNSTWLRNVITHELTHIFSLESKKKIQLSDIGIHFNMQTPLEEYVIREPFPKLTFYPEWFSEGIAQTETAILNHDCWDSRRDMVLRCAILDNRFLSLEEMGHFNHNSLGNEMVYNQGFSFTMFLMNKTGQQTIRNLFIRGSTTKINFNNYFSRLTGFSLNSLYKQWVDSLKDYHTDQIPSNPTSDSLIWNKGTYNYSPAVSQDGKYICWFSSYKDDGDRTDLVVSHSNRNKPLIRIKHAHTSAKFSHNSDKLYYIKSRQPNANGSFLNDIYCYDLKKSSEQRLTRNARIYDFAPLPDGNNFACIAFSNGIYSIYLFNISTGNFKRIIKGEIGQPFLHMSPVSTNSDNLVVSRIVNGKSQLFHVSIPDVNLQPLTSGAAQEESPFWAKDNRIYFSADYDGIFNIYSVDSKGNDLKRHTRCIGGYFSPVIRKNGSIICASYNSTGFSIVKINPVSENFAVQPSGYHCSFKPVPQLKSKLIIKAKPYEGTILRPIWELVFFGYLNRNKNIFFDNNKLINDSTEYQFGASLSKLQSDALGKRTKVVNLSLGLAGSSYNTDQSSNYLKTNPFFNSQNSSELDRYSDIFNRSLKENVTSKNESLLGFNSNANRKLRSHQTYSDDSENKSNVIPVFFPSIGFENNFTSATTGVVFNSSMAMGFIPNIIQSDIYAKWHLARDLYLGINANIQFTPFMDQMFEGAFPIVLNYQNIGYINEDISYNYADVSHLTVVAGPQFTKAIKTYANGDKIVVPKSLITGFDFIHAFPIAKFGSLQLITSNMMTFYDRAVWDEQRIIEGDSKLYLSSQSGLKTVFPIIRDINRRALYYWDALYGNLGYTFLIRANREFFKKLHPCNSNFFTEVDYSPNVYIGHFFHTGFELGHYKSYRFFKRLTFDFYFEFLRKYTFFTISAGLQ